MQVPLLQFLQLRSGLEVSMYNTLFSKGTQSGSEAGKKLSASAFIRYPSSICIIYLILLLNGSYARKEVSTSRNVSIVVARTWFLQLHLFIYYILHIYITILLHFIMIIMNFWMAGVRLNIVGASVWMWSLWYIVLLFKLIARPRKPEETKVITLLPRVLRTWRQWIYRQWPIS